MLVTRFDPFRELNDLRHGINHLNTALSKLDKAKKDERFDFVPSANTREADDAYFVEIDLPGIAKEEIAIDVDDKVLRVSGERKVRTGHKADDYYKVESRYGRFERRFALPEDVEHDAIEAASQEGVLVVKIPKARQLERAPKKIEIK
jgi:HSP20 family protein